MATWADRWTDRNLDEVEERIREIYADASRQLAQTVDDFYNGKFYGIDENGVAIVGKSLSQKDAEYRRLVASGKRTEEEYRQWRLAQEGRGERFETMRDTAASMMTDANILARSYISGNSPAVYAQNRNYEAYSIGQAYGIDGTTMKNGWAIFDESTVRKLLVEAPDIMPYYSEAKALVRGIDLEYGKNQITRVITSAIIAGNSISETAAILRERITDMNYTSSIRAARTATTAAQNAGRMDAYRDANERLGLNIKRRWMSCMDGRVRHEHQILDGQIAAMDEGFEVGGELIMFPGDPDAPGHLVYNCRCTLEGVFEENAAGGDRRARNDAGGWDIIEHQTYGEWIEANGGQWDPQKQVAIVKDPNSVKYDPMVEPDPEQPEKEPEKKADEKPEAKNTAAPDEPDRRDLTAAEKAYIGRMEKRNIADNPAQWIGEQSGTDAVNAIAGSDRTSGSCASAALAYIGRVIGYDVLDFRGGNSRDWFSGKQEKVDLWKACGISFMTEDSMRTSLANAKRMLDRMAEGVEYYLSAGGHAAIVRLSPEGKPQYLELQDETDKGWSDFEQAGHWWYGSITDTLKHRFGCKSSSAYYSTVYMTDISQCKGNEGFIRAMGFINTAEADQKKGAGGGKK